MKAILQVNNLSKQYGDYLALDKISFSLPKGQILGLLGPNGAGKTTTTQILLGLTSADSGTVQYFGKDFAKNRESILKRISFASTYSKLQGKISIKQNLQIYARLYEVKNSKEKIKDVLDLLEISHLQNKVFWSLSSGQQTRAILAKSLLNDPEIILMDEPTASLDPEIVNKMIQLIRTLREEKELSILFTSHNMEEVTRVCDKVMFLQQGKIVKTDTPSNLVKSINKAQLEVQYDAPKESVQNYLAELEYPSMLSKRKSLTIDLPEQAIAKTLFGFKKHDIFITDINIKKPTLEDVFLQITKDNV